MAKDATPRSRATSSYSERSERVVHDNLVCSYFECAENITGKHPTTLTKKEVAHLHEHHDNEPEIMSCPTTGEEIEYRRNPSANMKFRCPRCSSAIQARKTVRKHHTMHCRPLPAMQATSTTPIPQPLQFQGTTGIPNLMSMSSGSGLHIPSMPQTHLPQLAAETQQVIWTMMSMVHHLGRQGADMIDINGTLKSIAEQQRRLHEDQKSFRDDQNSFREEQNSFREEQNSFREELKSFREELKSFREEQHGFQDILVHNTVREREEQRSTNSAVLRRPFERSPPSNLPFASQERRSTQQPSPQEERCRR